MGLGLIKTCTEHKDKDHRCMAYKDLARLLASGQSVPMNELMVAIKYSFKEEFTVDVRAAALEAATEFIIQAAKADLPCLPSTSNFLCELLLSTDKAQKDSLADMLMNRVAGVIASRNEQHSALIGRYVKPIYMVMRKEIENRPVVVESVMNNLAATIDGLNCPDAGATLSLYTSVLEDYKLYPQHSYLFKMLLSLCKLVPPQIVVGLIPVIDHPLDRRLTFLCKITARFNASVTEQAVTFRQWKIVRDAVVEVVSKIVNHMAAVVPETGVDSAPTNSTPVKPLDGELDGSPKALNSEPTVLEGIANLLSTYFERDESIMVTIDSYAMMLARRILQIDARTKLNGGAATMIGGTPTEGEDYDFDMEYEEEPFEACGEESSVPYLVELLSVLKHIPMSKLSPYVESATHSIQANVSISQTDIAQELEAVCSRTGTLRHPPVNDAIDIRDTNMSDGVSTHLTSASSGAPAPSAPAPSAPAGLVTNATMGEGPDWSTVEEMDVEMRDIEKDASKMSIEKLCHVAKSKESFVKVLDIGGGQTIKTDTALHIRLRALRLIKTFVLERSPMIAGNVDPVLDACYYAIGDDVGHDTYEIGYAILLEFLDRYRSIPPVEDVPNNCAASIVKLINVTKAVIAYARFGASQDDIPAQTAGRERTRRSQIMADILANWIKDTPDI